MGTKRKLRKLVRDPRAFFEDALRNRIVGLIEPTSTPTLPPANGVTSRALGAVQEHLLAASLLEASRLAEAPAARRVYILTHVPFWRDSLGNQRRIFELFSYLERRFEPFCIYTGLFSFFDAKAIAKSGLGGRIVPLVSAGNALAYESEADNDDFIDRRSFVLRQSLDRLISAQPCRALISEYIVTEPLTRGLDLDCLSIMDTHDIMSRRMQIYAQHGRDHHIKISEAEEMQRLGRFDLVLAIQEEERQTLSARLGEDKAMLCAHPVAVRPHFKSRPPRRLVYVAGTNPANVDSMEWFLAQVWPRLGDLGLELHVFGTIAGRLATNRTVTSDAAIVLHGPIEDVETVYARGDIVINPVLYGGGLKIKTVEAMGYGLPAVTTAEGAAGLADLADRAFLVADTPEAFAGAVRRLATHPGLRKRLSDGALEAARSRFSPEACFGELARRIEAHRPARRKARVSELGAPHAVADETLLVIGQRDFPLFEGIGQFFDRFPGVTFAHASKVDTPAKLRDVMRTRCADRVFFLNPYTNRITQEIYDHCRADGVPYVCFDRGALPQSWFFDTRGFNGDSASYEPAHWSAPLAPAEQAATEAYIAAMRSGADALEDQGGRTPVARLRKSLDLGGKKVLFVPFQRPNDAVVRHFPGAAGGFEGFCRLVDTVARRLPEDWVVLGKTHPLEIDPPDTAIRLVPPDVHVNDLIELSDAVLTLNSGVGVLSLGFGKPTFCAGRAFYAQDGLARTVGSAVEAADRILSGDGPDQEAVLRFYGYLLHDFYSFGESRSHLRVEPDGEKSRITTAIRFDRLRMGDMVRWDSSPRAESMAAE